MPGRFAPSPTGSLHVGNLRTALIAWLLARSAGDAFRLRMEDLDRVTSAPEHERAQRADLVALGIDWDGEVWRQSERFAVYEEALDELRRAGLTYECFCSRREIREAAAAPHGDSALHLSRTLPRSHRPPTRRTRERSGLPPIRFRADAAPPCVDDVVSGRFDGMASDVVLRRNDGVPAYNLAVVVDDAAAGIDLVARGDDLLPSTPSQIAIGQALGLPVPRYAHVPLVVGPDGQRLTKRDGAITLSELAAAGHRRRGAARPPWPRRSASPRPASACRPPNWSAASTWPPSLGTPAGPVRLADVLAMAEQVGRGAVDVPRIGPSVLVASVRCGPPTAPPTGRDSTPLATA